MKGAKVQPLKVKHFVGGKFFRTYKVRKNHTLIGTTKDADILLSNKEIAGISCVFEKEGDHWRVLDMGSEPNVKLDGKSFVEAPLGDRHTLQINEHTFEITSFKKIPSIFQRSLESSGTKTIHVVRWKGNLICVTDNEEELTPFKMSGSPELAFTKVNLPEGTPVGLNRPQMDPELKKPLGGTIATFTVFILLALLWPKPKMEEQKPQDNQFTRMIYDGKILEQKKKQVVAGFARRSKAGTGNGNGAISEGAKGTASKASKAVISLRQSGLQSVIGRIAARAANNANLLAVIAGGPSSGQNRSPSSIGGINAMPTTGAISGTSGIGNGKGFTVGGIGTGGKGGGVGGYKSGTGLGTGTIGNGEVSLDDEESVIEGGLEREIIAGVIKEKLGQIRYCYERQLSANHDLHGKVKVRFTIDADGRVDAQTVSQSTLNSALVEECILRRIATWRFPKPKGGTKVVVSYPFLFKSVN